MVNTQTVIADHRASPWRELSRPDGPSESRRLATPNIHTGLPGRPAIPLNGDYDKKRDSMTSLHHHDDGDRGPAITVQSSKRSVGTPSIDVIRYEPRRYKLQGRSFGPHRGGPGAILNLPASWADCQAGMALPRLRIQTQARGRPSAMLNDPARPGPAGPGGSLGWPAASKNF